MFKFDESLKGQHIGNGTYGHVFKYGVNDVVKIILAIPISDLNQYLKEVIIGVSCNHSAIMQTSGFCLKRIDSEQEEKFDICLRMARRKSDLKHLIEERKKKNKYFSQNEVVIIFYKLVSALHYFFERRIAHRDIKPANILLDDLDNICISDLGCAQLVYKGETSKSLSSTEGTKKYMAPELLNIQRKLRKKDLFPADVWSTGITIIEVCLLEFISFSEIDNNNDKIKKINQIYKLIEVKYGELIAYLIQQMVQWELNKRPQPKVICEYLSANFPGILVTIEKRIN